MKKERESDKAGEGRERGRKVREGKEKGEGEDHLTSP